MIIEVIGEVLMPRYLAEVINNAASNSPLFSVGVAVKMVLTAILMMAGGIGGAYFGAKAAVNFAGDLRGDVYRRIQSYSFANMERFSSASLVTRSRLFYTAVRVVSKPFRTLTPQPTTTIIKQVHL